MRKDQPIAFFGAHLKSSPEGHIIMTHADTQVPYGLKTGTVLPHIVKFELLPFLSNAPCLHLQTIHDLDTS